MNLSDLQQIICDKESELARMRQAAVDAAQHQEQETREELMRMIEANELEMEATRREFEIAAKEAIQQAEIDAAAHIGRVKEDMEQAMRRREDEVFEAASAKIEEEWVAREACVREQFQAVLTAEMEEQHNKLTAHYEAIVREKEEALKAQEDTAKRQLSEMEEDHKRQMESMSQKCEKVAEEAWKDACEKLGAAADEEIQHNLAMAEEHCSARDEQISMLLEERSNLQKLVSEKESLLQDGAREINKLEKALEDATSEMHTHRDEEMDKLSEEAMAVLHESEHLQRALHTVECENKSIKADLARCGAERKQLETKCAEQTEAASTFDSEKKSLQSRINELSACKELLERQVADAKTESQDLALSAEGLMKRIEGLEMDTEKASSKASILSSKVDELDSKNRELEREHSDAVEQVSSLELERREYSRDMEDLLKRKDRLLAETLESLYNNASKSRNEPVVVHLHGNPNDTANAPSANERLSSECNNLRSKVLQLQRENSRLESESMNRRHVGSSGTASADDKRGDVEGLLQENNSLKTIVTMMRKEMETVASNNDSEGRDKASIPLEVVLEQQLAQCRSYLDLLLEKRSAGDGHGYRDDEVAFLRSKYQELHRSADELREENARLHRQCNATAGRNEYDGLTLREQELIQRLEEATDEIEALMNENEKLMKLSNELRYELQLASGMPKSRNPSLEQGKIIAQEHEQTMLDAILNDQSRSCDSESHESEVACVGRKPPLTNAANSRPSKTAYGSRPKTASDRATASQRQSFQSLVEVDRKKKEIARKKKAIAAEKTKLRNWNVKDPSSNPYL